MAAVAEGQRALDRQRGFDGHFGRGLDSSREEEQENDPIGDASRSGESRECVLAKMSKYIAVQV